jgi:hypothetical protein
MMRAISSVVGCPALFTHELAEAFDDDGLVIGAPIGEGLVKSDCDGSVARVGHDAFSPTY